MLINLLIIVNTKLVRLGIHGVCVCVHAHKRNDVITMILVCGRVTITNDQLTLRGATEKFIQVCYLSMAHNYSVINFFFYRVYKAPLVKKL